LTAEYNIIRQLKPLAAEYYRLTGKPLGVTGEIGEQEVARLLNLNLAPVRTPGYDATDRHGKRYQIKTRSLTAKGRSKSQMTSKFPMEGWDAALLTIMDEHFEVLEIWEAERAAVMEQLDKPGSRSRNERRIMSLGQFRAIGRKRYPC